MLLALGIATVLSGLCLVFARPIMKFVCGGGEVLEIAASYYRINAYGFFFQILTMCITACFRGIGITKLPMIYNLIGGAVNVVLNYLLIYGKCGLPALRADGAAWATSISKMLIFAIALGILVFKKTEIRYRKDVSFRLDVAFKKRLLPIGLSAAGEQVVLQSGALLMAKVVALLPVAQIAANQIVANVETFAWASGGACAVAATSLFGRSIGEGKPEKGRAYLRFIIKWAILFAIVEMVVFMALGRPLAALFTSDQSLYPMIMRILLIAAITLPLIGTHQSVSGALRSAGDTVAPLVASIISLWVIRLIPGFFLIKIMGMGIYAYRFLIFADQGVRLLVVAIFYLTGHWRKKLK